MERLEKTFKGNPHKNGDKTPQRALKNELKQEPGAVFVKMQKQDQF
ncbi:MAG: hypothetical protein IPJ37_04155 [Bacteroidales bacterium]|nr:hypothetical protein [Bacteroidales bacterium]